jgi:hypothetical protein
MEDMALQVNNHHIQVAHLDHQDPTHPIFHLAPLAQQLQEALHPLCPAVHVLQMETIIVHANLRTSVQLDPPDLLEKLDLMVCQVFPELMESPENLPKTSTTNQPRDASLAQPENKAQLAQVEDQESEECVDQRAHQDFQAATETQDNLVNKVQLELPATTANQDNLERKVKTQKNQLEEKETVDPQAHKDQKANKVMQERTELPEHLESQDQKDPPDSLEPLELMEKREEKDPQVDPGPTQNTAHALAATMKMAQMEVDQVEMVEMVQIMEAIMVLVALPLEIRPEDTVAASSKRRLLVSCFLRECLHKLLFYN